MANVMPRNAGYLWFSVALIFVIAAATAWDVLAGHRAHRGLVERQMVTLATSAAAQTEASVRAIDLLLQDAAKSIDPDRWPDQEIEARLRARLQSFPEIRNLLVVDPHGRMVGRNLSTTDVAATNVDLSDREYFVYQRNNWAQGQLYIAAPVTSRLHNQPSIPVSRPLPSRDGTFAGVVVVGLDPVYFESLLQAVAAGDGLVGTLLRRDGVILARHPEGDTFRGRSVAAGSILREHVPRQPVGAAEVVSPLEHETRLIGYAALKNYPLVMLVVTPLEAAFGEWRQRALHGVATVLVLSVAILLLAALLERRERQRRAAVAAAERASRAKSDLLANVSHELRTPLNAIIGFTDLMLSGVMAEPVPPQIRGYLHDIHVSGAHLLDLINEILDVAALDAGKLTLRNEEVDLNELAAVCLRLIGPTADKYGVRVEGELPPLPRVSADRRRLKEVLLNLLSNSAKFTPAGGRVVLSGDWDPAGGVRLTVADTGIGMTPEELATAMQPFGQVDSRAARVTDGTGLGLPLCKGLTELHGGELVIDSTPGRGTRATVRLPAGRLLGEPAPGARDVTREPAPVA